MYGVLLFQKIKIKRIINREGGTPTYITASKGKRKCHFRHHPDFGTTPPWLPVTTKTAASIVGVHTKTLLRWAREDGGPQPIDRDEFLFNQLFWTPGRLVEWLELRETGKTRDFQQICQDWVESGVDVMKALDEFEEPAKPRGRHLRRRRRERKRQLI